MLHAKKTITPKTNKIKTNRNVFSVFFFLWSFLDVENSFKACSQNLGSVLLHFGLFFCFVFFFSAVFCHHHQVKNRADRTYDVTKENRQTRHCNNSKEATHLQQLTHTPILISLSLGKFKRKKKHNVRFVCSVRCCVLAVVESPRRTERRWPQWHNDQPWDSTF